MKQLEIPLNRPADTFSPIGGEGKDAGEFRPAVMASWATVPAPPVFFSGARIVAMTFQPLAANNVAAALPMPEEQPVMSTVFIRPEVIATDLISTAPRAHKYP